MRLNVTVLKTPELVKFGNDLDLTRIKNALSTELNKEKNWNDSCSNVLCENPKALFLFDRMEFFLGNAFGSHKFKQALNPLMIKCHHPNCIGKSVLPRKLRNVCDISCYIDHLKDHCDAIGIAMLKRFSAAMCDNMITMKSLNEISVSPADLIGESMPLFSLADIDHLNRYGIDRQLNTSYICHWKDKMIKSSLIDSSSLSFQEDDALAYMALSYPNPVTDWKQWRTLYFYAMKILCSIGATALNLHRGTTDYERLQKSGKAEQENIHSFMGNINHPAPSITAFQRFLPRLLYENETYHSFESLFHLEVLGEMENSIKLDFDNVTVYPSTLGVDEQVLNPGTFEYEGHLYGLAEKMSAESIRSVGLNNLAKHIAENNPYITSVCEYHITDLVGNFCSNVYSKFESTSLKHETCTDDLSSVVNLATKCSYCIKSNCNCEYELLSEQCRKCSEDGIHCSRFGIFNVLWDMASPHKKTSNSITKIDGMSTQIEYLQRNLHSIAFGGLHLAKAVINSSRNHVLNHNGENFGVNILWFVKNDVDRASEMLSSIKNAVFVGKDRQSDYLSYMTCCPTVQNALKEKERYSLIKIPERIKTYTQNAKSQRRFILPVSVKCNMNGDIFVLDSGIPCLHIIDRSTVSKCFTVGSHNPTKKYPQKRCTSNEIMFSKGLADMEIIKENIFIADTCRNEIVILINCSNAKKISSSKISLLEVEGPLSMCACKGMLLVLKMKDGAQTVQGIHFQISQSPIWNYTVTFDYVPDEYVGGLFSFIPSITERHFFGVRLSSNSICFMELNDNDTVQTVSHGVELTSSLDPTISDGNIYTSDGTKILKYSLTVKEDQYCVAFPVEDIPSKCPVLSLLSAHGNVVYSIGKLSSNVHVLEESGLLNFAVSFCEAVHKFYNAVAYIPPHGDKSVRLMKMSDCIESAKPLKEILQSMQVQREDIFPSRTSFQGNDGIPFTQTIDCIAKSIEAWESVCLRLDTLSESNLSDMINPHALTNEALVERSFGFTMKRGQGHQQNMMEYIQSRRNVVVDFMIKMCITPFNQYTKVKLRDKGYQNLDDDRKSKIKVEKLLDLFPSTKKNPTLLPTINSDSGSNDSIVEDENAKKILRSAFLLTKSVPRATNRTKWKQASGYVPDLLQYTNPHKLVKGDLVFFSQPDDTLLYLQVVEDLVLDHDSRVKVFSIFEEKPKHIFVQCEKLVKDDDGLVFTIPKEFYKVEKNKSLSFNDMAKELFNDFINRESCRQFSDVDWATLCEEPDIDFSVYKVNSSKTEEVLTMDEEEEEKEFDSMKKRKTEYELNLTTKKTKLRKNILRILDSDEEEDDVASTPECSRENTDAQLFTQKGIPIVWKYVLENPNALAKKWFACIYQPRISSSKRKVLAAQLILGPALSCSVAHGQYVVKIDCCKPYDMLTRPDTVEEYARKGGDEWEFRLRDIFAGPLAVTFSNNRTWLVENMALIVRGFETFKASNRDFVISDFMCNT